jgi:hypothetical protein
MTGRHGRRSPGILDEQVPLGGVSDRCQVWLHRVSEAIAFTMCAASLPTPGRNPDDIA